jgi:hypothetical protein
MIGAAPERHPAWPGLVRARRARSRRPQSLASGAGTVKTPHAERGVVLNPAGRIINVLGEGRVS